jgi:hypothetical protein
MHNIELPQTTICLQPGQQNAQSHGTRKGSEHFCCMSSPIVTGWLGTLSQDCYRTSGRYPVKPLQYQSATGFLGGRSSNGIKVTREVASPKDSIPKVPRPSVTSRHGATAQCGVPPKSPKLGENFILRERRAHVSGEPGYPRRERERGPAHVGQYERES